MQPNITLPGLNGLGAVNSGLPVLDDELQAIVDRLKDGQRQALAIVDRFKQAQKQAAGEAMQRARDGLRNLEKTAQKLSMLGLDPTFFLDMASSHLRPVAGALKTLREGATAQQQADLNRQTREITYAAERIGYTTRLSSDEDNRTKSSRRRLADAIYTLRRVDIRI